MAGVAAGSSAVQGGSDGKQASPERDHGTVREGDDRQIPPQDNDWGDDTQEEVGGLAALFPRGRRFARTRGGWLQTKEQVMAGDGVFDYLSESKWRGVSMR